MAGIKGEIQDIESMAEVLEQGGCSFYRHANDGEGFDRFIQFNANNIECWISWWVNVAYLSVGGRYVCDIPFDYVKCNKTWPKFWKSLEFIHEGETQCYLALKLLPWQGCEEDI